MATRWPNIRFAETAAVPVALCIALLVSSVSAYAGDERVIASAKRGDVKSVSALLAAGADSNSRAGDGTTAIHWAAHNDDLRIADLLLAKGAKANVANDIGATPLWLACQNGSAAMVKKLLSAGADANAALPSGETVLMAASQTGSVEVVEMLLAHHAQVNPKEGARGQTALMWAAAGGHAGVVEKLLRAGADIHARTSIRRRVVNTETGGFGKQQLRDVDMGGFTPLLLAARSGSVESARWILEAGGDPNEKAADGTSALVVAAHSGHAEMGAFLLSKGADPNASEAGYTPLHAAILRDEPELVSALLSKGANVNAPLLKGTPARRASADWVLEWTLAGASPLWLAAKFGEPDIMRVLATAGADPKFTREDGTTVLMAGLQKVRRQEPGVTPDAVLEEANVLETIKTALELGADVNGFDKEGNTAVHLAVTKRYASVVEVLAANNADLNKKNKKNQTPLRLALDSEKDSKRGEQAARSESPISALLTKLGAVAD